MVLTCAMGRCPVGERAGVGAQLKVQAKAKLDQISEDPAPREGMVQDMRLEIWSRSIRGPQRSSVAMG